MTDDSPWSPLPPLWVMDALATLLVDVVAATRLHRKCYDQNTSFQSFTEVCGGRTAACAEHTRICGNTNGNTKTSRAAHCDPDPDIVKRET